MKKSASFNSQFKKAILSVVYTKSARQYCSSQRLLLFTPSLSFQIFKIDGDIMIFFQEHPFFCGPQDLLTLSAIELKSQNQSIRQMAEKIVFVNLVGYYEPGVRDIHTYIHKECQHGSTLWMCFQLNFEFCKVRAVARAQKSVHKWFHFNLKTQLKIPTMA